MTETPSSSSELSQTPSSSSNSAQEIHSEQNFSQGTENKQESSSLTRTETSSLTTPSGFDIEQIAPASYMPSEFERKRAVLMYCMFGIFMALQGDTVISDYEWFHLRQALGRRVIFCLMILLLILYIAVFFFVFWFMMFLPAIAVLLYLGLRSYFVYQAWTGKDVMSPNTHITMPMFSDLGSWILGVFEISQKS